MSPGSSRAGLALGVLAVACAAILIRQAHTPPLATAAWRLDLAAAGFVLIALLRGNFEWPRSRRVQAQIVGAGVFLGLHFATWISSLAYTTVAASVLLVTTNPIFVGLGSALLLQEPVSRRLWAGIALSTVGGVLVALGAPANPSTAPAPALGNALALAGAVFGSAYILIGRNARAQLDNLAYVTPLYLVAAIFLTVLALATGTPMTGFTSTQWMWLALIAAIPQGIGHTMINWSLRYLSSAQVAVAILGEPVGAVILAWLVLGEAAALMQVVGGLLVLVGVGISSRG
ncbi:MAG: DMT family transporter [Armatimonadetes bacterium]|nr:DMT family transporter [Armatimonadota bacterium]